MVASAMDRRFSEVAAALEDAGLAAHVYDGSWRLIHVTESQRRNMGSPLALGEHVLSPAFTACVRDAASLHLDASMAHAERLVPYIVGSHPGGREAVRASADEHFHELIDSVEPIDPPPLWTDVMDVRARGLERFPLRAVTTRIDGPDGAFAGAVELWLPALRSELLNLLALADPGNLERMASVARAARRPSGILFADLEASTALARRLPTDAYFRLIRRVMRAADQIVIAHAGLVGRHAGDGISADVPAELAGGEAEAARRAVATGLELGRAAVQAASDVPGAPELRVNVGLHWGATVRIGALLTASRLEVTALGEEVNEAARIEACATGGRVLASKALLERLEDDAPAVLGVAAGTYRSLADVDGAPDKARRDAPTLTVRELAVAQR
jgi:class 3 adenylate cyclase